MGELGTATGIANGSDAEQRARQMRLAGVLFIFGSLFGVPSTLILTEVGPGLMLPFTALGITSGVVCLLAPWERISPGWAHAALVAAVAEVGVVALVTDSSFLIYYVMIGVFVSYAFADRRVLGAYLALITLVLLAHGVFYAGDDQAATQLAMLTIPVVLVSAVMVAYLREQQEASRLKYQRFAEEAMELAARLRGQAEQGATPTPAGAEAGLPAAVPPQPLAGPDLRRAGLGFAGIVLAIPLGLASLAAAGVALPDAANDAFKRVGISLPNQEGGAEMPEEAAGTPAGTPASDAERRRSSGNAAGGHDDPGRTAKKPGPGRQAQGDATAGSPTGSAGAPSSQAPAPPAPAPDPIQQPGGGTDGPGLPAPLDRVLRDTLDLLNGAQPKQPPAAGTP